MQISTNVSLFGISIQCKSSCKIEQSQKRYLRIILADYPSDYKIQKGKTSNMNAKRMRILATEIFKTINNLNPSFMKDTFTSQVNPKVRSSYIIVKRHNATKYRTKYFQGRKYGIPYQNLFILLGLDPILRFILFYLYKL